MSFGQDFENMINRCIKHPEHHQRRRERFLAIRATEILSQRTTFGQRKAPPATW